MLTTLIERYHQFAKEFYTNADPRNDQYPLMYSWWPTLFMCLLYIWLVQRGQTWMRSRPALELRRTMICYNVAMVLWSVYLVWEFMAAGWWGDMGFGCELVNPAWEEKPLRMLRAGYLYYLTKLVEMLDTLFFVLRKKNFLITFLHVFHHAAMPASVWFGIKFAPGGSGSFYAMVNSMVHIFMYSYYALAAAGPSYSRFLWWKPLMTVIQMAQFIAFILHNHQFIFTKPCAYPLHFSVAIYIYAWIFLVLFSNYFIKENLRRFRRVKPGAERSLANGTSRKTKVERVQEKSCNGATHSVPNGNGSSPSTGDLKNRKKR